MTAECIPGGFEWKDPSKIHVGEVFCLLDHWRDRKDQGLEPLVWIQTSPLFKNTNPYMQPVRCPEALDPHDSGEVFVLPDSDEPDEEKDSQAIHTPIDHVSAFGGSSTDERSTGLEAQALQTSTLIDGNFGESNISCV